MLYVLQATDWFVRGMILTYVLFWYLKVLTVQDESIVEPFPENFTDTFEYSYPNVTELLGTYGVRSLEFDCYYDPEGGTPLPKSKLD